MNSRVRYAKLRLSILTYPAAAGSNTESLMLHTITDVCIIINTIMNFNCCCLQMRIVVDFLPSSFRSVECVVKKEHVGISQSSASVDYSTSTKQVTCAAFGAPPIISSGTCK